MTDIDPKLGKIKPQQDPEEDYDFDFSIYDDDDNGESVVDAKNLPTVTGLRSRFSPGEYNLKRIAWLDIKISKLSIQVGMFVQDYQILLEFLSTINEKWQIIKYVFGTATHDDINNRRRVCDNLLEQYKNAKIPNKVHHNLLALRDFIDMNGQFANLGIEVERINRGIYSKIKEDITE